jgi:large subunit ribosomal protein L10e
MGIRPAKCYTNPRGGKRIRTGASGHARKINHQRAYTRVAITAPDRNYIGATPALRIRQFNMGNPMLPYNTVAELVVTESIDIRDNAIERQDKVLQKNCKKHLEKKILYEGRVYPSHLLRENKQAQGAGADRVSQGMCLAFGIPVGRATRVRAGQTIFSVLCMDTQKNLVKEALRGARTRFPCSVKVEFHSDVKSIGTIPNKVIEEKVVEVAKTETTTPAEGAAATTEAGKTPAAGAKAESTGKTPTAGKEAAGAKTDAKAASSTKKK